MACILYCWELGGGFGHIHAFLPIARRLRTDGHEVVFVVRDLLNAEPELNRHGFRSLQAPLWQGRLVGLPDPPANFSEILLHFGFFRADDLLGLVRAWLELFRLLHADLIIGDYSPCALLAARIATTRAATFGTGFCRPPALHPLPALRPWLPATQERLLASDRKIVATVNEVLKPFGSFPIGRIADLFAVDEDFLCTYSELDHYPERPCARYWGAVFNLEQGIEATWPGRERFRIFCYVKPGWTGFKTLIRQLPVLKRHEIVLFCPGLAQNLIDRYASPHLTIHRSPIRLDALLPQCDLAVCHGGHGTVCAMLQAGIPLLLLPMNLEQFLTGQRVEALGAGLAVEDAAQETDYPEAMAHLLKSEYRQSARRFTERYAEFTQESIHERILTRILALAKRGD